MSFSRQAFFIEEKMETNKIKIKSRIKKMLADTITPVSIYLKIRDKFGQSLLLESSDYHGSENSLSFICMQTLASFILKDKKLIISLPDREPVVKVEFGKDTVVDELNRFISSFNIEGEDPARKYNGFFGYMGYDSVRFFEKIKLETKGNKPGIPDIHYCLFRYLIIINHFNDEMILLENYLPGEASGMERIETMVLSRNFPSYPFETVGQEYSNLNDEEYKDLVRKGKHHCQMGDVFQIVFSRQFSQAFKGDEFNVYRSLRSINPSPYLFYFDYGNYRIFGSSPEALLVIKENKAQIHPIAGTFRRTGNDIKDTEIAKQLIKDPKENAEHVMLVDLARNDLSRNTRNVRVVNFKEIQFYSHVIHLVSMVEGELDVNYNPVRILADTFPAGTLSGAPKHRAMTLINKYENQPRGFYGGGIGYIGLTGDLNHAIIIRSFLSYRQKLYYQAGAGIVIDSHEEKELKEVNNKLAALKLALTLAKEI